jgi:hypothetical protein
MMDDDECGAVGGIRVGKGNGSNRRKSTQMPLCHFVYMTILQCVRQNRQTTKKTQADTHARSNKIKKQKTAQEKHKWKRAERDHVKKSKNQRSRFL